MKKNFLFVAAMAACVSFTSCSNDEAENISAVSFLDVENVGLSDLDSRVGIRADKFTDGETIGLFVYDGAIGSAYNNQAGVSTVNVPYKEVDGDWVADQPIVLSTVEGTVYAYYPYHQDNTNAAAIPVTVVADQGTGQGAGVSDKNEAQIDYMWADKVEGISNADNGVDIAMNHALAMVSFKFVQTSNAGLIYPGVGKVSSIVLKNAQSKSLIKTGAATMNIGDQGKLTLGQTATAGITIEPSTTTALLGNTDEDLTPRMLVFPVAAISAGDILISVTVDGNEYTVQAPALAAGYKAGFNHEYTLKMTGTGLEINGDVAVKEWQPVPAGEIDVQKPDNAI